MKGITFFLLLVSFSALHSQPVTLRDTTNQYDYIIITIPEFVNACEPFKQHKETVRDFRTLIVDTTQIFAEFDSSATPQDNIRNFISFAGTFWKEPRPKFFLIVGTVTMVPNFLIPFPSQPTIYFHSDYYYYQNIYENDSTTTDFYIGRIPVNDSPDLGNYFSKVIEYESNNTLFPWMNNNLFICQNDIQFGFYEAATFLADSALPNYMRSYFFLDDSSSLFYGNKDSIINFVNNRGCSIIWFEGHHKDSSFISPDYFNLNDIQGFNNYSKYFISIFVATQNSILDTNSNLSNEMIKMYNSGSIGGIVHVGPSYWGIGNMMRLKWAERLFDPTIQSISEAFLLDALPSGGVYSYMKKITNLWADPSLKLKYDITLDVDDHLDENLPKQFALFQNYPNPFNPSTTIKFTLPVDSRVKINVYNSLGQLVET
ncbi:MAG: C25 family cysteine peptidase, partial [Ignavibacteriaceae bacterium]|nr:C25 family cysteine peptidase [Ignavibacteriaceae bacterium]